MIATIKWMLLISIVAIAVVSFLADSGWRLVLVPLVILLVLIDARLAFVGFRRDAEARAAGRPNPRRDDEPR